MNPISTVADTEPLITHSNSQKDFNASIKAIKKRIIQEGDKSDSTVEEQLKLVEELTQFGFGRFLLENQGINGFWTRHMVLWPKFKLENNLIDSIHPLEKWLLEEAPIIQATQQRFIHFQKLLQDSLKENMVLASIPCGMMDDLLTLDFSRTSNIKMVGIDLDEQSLAGAKETAYRLNLMDKTTFIQKDAWKLDIENEFDIITSNGLNFYEPSDDRVIELYKKFYNTLKADGVLITSFLTPPPSLSSVSPWEMKKLNLENLRIQKVIVSYILSAKFQTFRTESKTVEQLKKAGFKEIKIIYDQNKLFPTIVARK